MDSLAAGRVPFVNASASGGEPLLANPNAVLLYPTLLLEKVLAPAAAFNLHYLLHVLWAFFGARALARRLGLPGGPAFFSAVAFAFSGIMMSYGSAFANSGAAASWLPWCAAAALDLVRARGAGRTPARGRRRRDRLRPAAAGRRAGALSADRPLRGVPRSEVFEEPSSPSPAGEERDRLVAAANLLAGGALAGLAAAALASPLLLPLLAVFPLTYRGQHLYSERAFGASPFARVADDRVALPPLRRGPRGARRRSALAVRASRGRDRLHLVRDAGSHPSRRRPDRRRAPRLLDAPDGLARREARSSRSSLRSAPRSPSSVSSSRSRPCAGCDTRSSSTC